MSFSITLQQNNSDVRKLDKSLSTIATVTGTLKEGTSIINPVILIDCDISNVNTCNYMTIESFNRQYFVNDIKSIRNGLVEFSCHVDVLSTYATEIKGNRAIVRRQENDWNLYLNDGVFKVYQNPVVTTIEFPQGFATPEFVLAVAGS